MFSEPWAPAAALQKCQRGVIKRPDLLPGIERHFFDIKRHLKLGISFDSKKSIATATPNRFAGFGQSYPPECLVPTRCQGLRLDLTSQKEFTISQTTKDLVNNLQEPLLIRAYLSKNAPLTAAINPQIEDMLREYEIASKGLLNAEVVESAPDSKLNWKPTRLTVSNPNAVPIAGQNQSFYRKRLFRYPGALWGPIGYFGTAGFDRTRRLPVPRSSLRAPNTI